MKYEKIFVKGHDRYSVSYY